MLSFRPLDIEDGERAKLTVNKNRNPKHMHKKRRMVLYGALTFVVSFVLVVSFASKGAGGAPPADPAPPIDAITVIDGETILDEAWQRLNPNPLDGVDLVPGSDLPLNWTPDLDGMDLVPGSDLPLNWTPDLEPDPATDPTNNGTDTDYVECHYMFGGGSLTEAGDECRMRKLLRLLTMGMA